MAPCATSGAWGILNKLCWCQNEPVQASQWKGREVSNASLGQIGVEMLHLTFVLRHLISYSHPSELECICPSIIVLKR